MQPAPASFVVAEDRLERVQGVPIGERLEGFAGLHGLQLRQTILCELFDDQVNQVLIKFPDREATLEFKNGEGFKVIN